MRPRHSVQLLALAALPVLLALILVGNGSLSAPSNAAPVLPADGRLARVSLQLLGGSTRIAANQCGAVRHYTAFPSRGTIRFSGTIAPRGPWALTLKLKACYAGAFESAGDVQAKVSPNGTYSGSFPIPIAGYYFARAELRRYGQQIARSTKVLFEIP
jgi:hypothetical protein